MSRVNW